MTLSELLPADLKSFPVSGMILPSVPMVDWDDASPEDFA